MLSSPITVMLARQHGHAVSSGASVTSIRGRCAGSAPRLARRLAALSRRQLGISLLRLRVFFGDRLLEGFQAQLQLFLRQTLRAGAEMHASQLQQQMTQPVILCQQNVPLRDRRIALGQVFVAIGNCPSTNARNASMPSGRLCRSSRGESVTQQILRGNRRFENPLYGLNTRPIEPIEQAANSTGDSFITPSMIGGQRNDPCCNCL